MFLLNFCVQPNETTALKIPRETFAVQLARIQFHCENRTTVMMLNKL